MPQRELRYEERGDVMMPGKLRHNVTCRTETDVIDLSTRGCRISVREKGITVGSTAFIRLDNLAPLRATVRWHAAGFAGVEFDWPLYLPVHDHLLNAWRFTVAAKLAPI